MDRPLHRNHFLDRYRRKHPTHWLSRLNDKIVGWLTHHVLPSMVMFDIALVVPLATITTPDWIKMGIVLLLSNWIQWWALPALQRSSNEIQAKQDAKADADHAVQQQIHELTVSTAQKIDVLSDAIQGLLWTNGSKTQ